MKKRTTHTIRDIVDKFPEDDTKHTITEHFVANSEILEKTYSPYFLTAWKQEFLRSPIAGRTTRHQAFASTTIQNNIQHES